MCERVQADAVGTVEQLHLQAMVGPVDKVDVASLVVEWIKGDVELTRSDELASRHPVHYTGVSNAHPEPLVEQFVVDRLGTRQIRKSYSHDKFKMNIEMENGF